MVYLPENCCKETEEALRKSEERFQHLATDVPGAIFEFIRQPDGTNYFSYISPTGCRALASRLKRLLNI